MKVEDFDYQLPSEKIAQRPLPQRDQSKLLVLRRQSRELQETVFSELPGLLDPGDLVVVNDARVRPLRLRGKKLTGGRVELTLVKQLDEDGCWECLARIGNPRPGLELEMDGGVNAELVDESPSLVRVNASSGAPLWRVRFFGGDLDEALASAGLPPLPPYVKRRPGDDPASDHERYQTVYASGGTAAAAPTAGLHFTESLLEGVAARGVEIARARLDVSWGTFAPVRTDEVEDHRMHPERYQLSEEVVTAVAQTRARGGRVIAVGTTVVRTLEHCAGEDGTIRAGAGETSLFVYPGYRFRAVDALLTNFHMPRSTLMMLVAAFAGREFLLEAYERALGSGFRFLSYGDAMLIL